MRQTINGWTLLKGGWIKELGHLTLEVVERGDTYQASLIRRGHPIRARPIHSGVDDAKAWAEDAASEYFEIEAKEPQS